MFLGINDDNIRAHYINYLKHALARMEDVIFYGLGYENYEGARFLGIIGSSKRHDILQIIERVYDKDEPDVIVIAWPFDWYMRNCNWKNLEKTVIPKVVILGDPHHRPLDKIEYINQNKIDLALTTEKRPILQMKDKINCTIEWLPISVNTNVFKPYDLPRRYDVTLLGAMNPKYYPLRVKITKILSKRSDIAFFSNEHGREWESYHKKTLIRKNYARVIAQSKILVFCGGIYNYAIAKFHEGMACNTLVMAPMPFDGEDLHFKPGYNFVTIDDENFMEKIRYYLEHEDERKEIAKRGYETVKKYHTTEIRAKQLVDYLKQIKVS